jgi:hypothetical protein
MRSLLSQFQTPTTPRSTVGFFGFGCSTNHSVELITQPTSDRQLLEANPFSRRRKQGYYEFITVNAYNWCNLRYFLIDRHWPKRHKAGSLQDTGAYVLDYSHFTHKIVRNHAASPNESRASLGHQVSCWSMAIVTSKDAWGDID